MQRIRAYLGSTVDGGSLAALRIGFGLVLAWALWEFVRPLPGGSTALDDLVTGNQTHWHFSYPGFEWCLPLPSTAMRAVVWGGVAASLLMAAGLLTRLSTLLSVGSFTYIWVSEATLYGNQFWLATVFGLLLLVVPTGRRYSIDASIGHRLGRSMPLEVPFWTIFLLRSQVVLVYFFGGLCKLHPDWLAGEPMRTWFQDGATAAMIGRTLSPNLADNVVLPILHQEFAVTFFTIGGLVFDLLIGLLLILRRTRLFGLVLMSLFHTFNLFFVGNVGVVAVLAWWVTLIFLPPGWPSQLARWFRVPTLRPPDTGWFLAGMVAVPLVGAFLGWKASPLRPQMHSDRPMSRIAFSMVALWLAVQIAVPLRHWFIAGDVYWTTEGTAFGWFLMTCNKDADLLQIRVVDEEMPADDLLTLVDTRDEKTFGDEAFFVVFEPMFGHRIFSEQSDEHALASDEWRIAYGRVPVVAATRSGEETLDEMSRRIRSATRDPELAARLTQTIGETKQLLGEMRLARQDSDLTRTLHYLLAGKLHQLASDASGAPLCLAALFEAKPFAFTPAGPLEGEYALVMDLGFPMIESPHFLRLLDLSSWKGPRQLVVDTRFLTHPMLEVLPAVTRINGTDEKHEYLWNQTREINTHQEKAVGFFPYLLQSYCRHVADRWEQEHGRRPEVRARAFLWLNHHGFQPLVDPEVDLSRASFSLLRHNTWILPHDKSKVFRREVDSAAEMVTP